MGIAIVCMVNHTAILPEKIQSLANEFEIENTTSSYAIACSKASTQNSNFTAVHQVGFVFIKKKKSYRS